MSSPLFDISYKGDFINGRFVPVTKGDGEFKDVSPADLSDVIMKVGFKHDHIDEACAAAKKAYPQWAMLSLDERKKYLLRVKELFDANVEQMAQLISRDTGKPLWEGINEAKLLGSKIDITLNQSLKLVAEERITNALPQVDGVIRHRSRGVMAVVGPFNFPAHLPNGHIIPALIAGNTVVFKPSEQTPAVGQFMAELYERAQLPPGVFNLVQGDGAAGGRLVANENVDGILFTGSYEVGLKIKQETLNQYWKILALEMGGKNATVVWDDADLEKAIYETLVGAYMSSGQRCSGTSRVILHPKIADEFTEKFYQAAKKLSIGHWSENTFMGSLINAAAVEKYIRFQEIANRENCESLMRGKSLDLKHKGFYVTPSIHLVKKFDPNSVYQKSEIFGPNVAIHTTDNFDEAMHIVNSSGYGLVMALFSKNKELYEQALFKARVGLLNWNRTTNGASSRLPFGGMGKSGNDRPSAHFAIQYCTVPVASLEDPTPFDPTKVLPGMNLDTK
ncbi:N-succinylglutamate 5-semialdehyde dehydrogenase [Bdellovibrio bacteriovorus]|uniref:N-succinylglutamate 5-semialdehyde dehydrogenase n=1 Tax=Bdellovibrio bacteriovorus TaxID=959 RepID=A0A150WRK9_BDEBC|nr:succinylglutamate-semialdehyde dehydrogenase [Bdellovibrio bacteriovorus]KYG66845.1 N-succinylglutamate 5-semialdehyde dehydrogenase [Bdellovibrio bacteriovorus]